MPSSIIVFALAIAAAVLAVSALLSALACRRTVNRYYRSLEAQKARISACENGLKATSGAQLAATVADLDAAVTRLAESSRKQFGSLWGKLGALEQREREEEPEPERLSRAELRQRYLRNPITGGAGGE